MSNGIYKFENKINHMVYIGQAVDLEARYEKHLKNIKDKNHKEDLYLALREYGIDNFEYTVLISNVDNTKLDELEIYYINFYNSLKPNGYNMVPGGSNGAGLAKGKIVEQYTLEGIYIKTFNSAHQAEYETKISYGNICSCCRGDRNQAGGYQWKYKDSDKQIITIKKCNHSNGVLQFSKEGEFIKEFTSVTEAAQELHCSKAAITKACQGKSKTSQGFIWKYKNLT